MTGLLRRLASAWHVVLIWARFGIGISRPVQSRCCFSTDQDGGVDRLMGWEVKT